MDGMKGRIMIHTIKKKLAIGLLCALSISIASPVEAATIKETTTKKLKDAYGKFEKQWKKIKPCIIKRKCTKKQIAAFVGAAIIVVGLVSGGIIYWKRQREIAAREAALTPQEIALAYYNQNKNFLDWAIQDAKYWYRPNLYDNNPMIETSEFEPLFYNLHTLQFGQLEKLVTDMLNLALKFNKRAVYKYKAPDYDPYNELERRLEKMRGERGDPMNKHAAIVEFFEQLSLIPAENKAEVNELLGKYGIDPI